MYPTVSKLKYWFAMSTYDFVMPAYDFVMSAYDIFVCRFFFATSYKPSSSSLCELVMLKLLAMRAWLVHVWKCYEL